MRHPLTSWIALPAAAAVITALFLSYPLPSRDPLTGVPIDPEFAASNASLETRRITALRRITLKDELVSALIDGRLTLAQVTAEFLRLNAEDEAVLWVVRQSYAGATDEEKSARNILHFVSIRDFPNGERSRVQERLDSEFTETFERTTSAAKNLPLPTPSRHRP